MAYFRACSIIGGAVASLLLIIWGACLAFGLGGGMMAIGSIALAWFGLVFAAAVKATP